MQFLKYIISGVINTVVGYSVFFIFLRFFNMIPEYANAIGYGVALIFSFLLNKLFVFDKLTSYEKVVVKFSIAFAISFIVNQLVLIASYRIMNFSIPTAQIFAMISYTAVFYFLNKYFVFCENSKMTN